MIPGTFWPDVARIVGEVQPGGYSSKTSPATVSPALKPCREPYGTWVSRLRLAYSLRQKSAPPKAPDFYRGPTATATASAQTAKTRRRGRRAVRRWRERPRIMGDPNAGFDARRGWTAEELETSREEVRRETLAKGNHTGNGFGLSLGRRPVSGRTPAARNVKKRNNEHHARGRQVRMDICTIARNRLFPPGPSDSAAWSDTPHSCARSGARCGPR